MPEQTPEALEEARARYTYDHIPSLKELMPTTAGIPGVEYAQVCVHNIRLAQDLGWGRISGNQKVYTITGPTGSVDCELYCKGKPISGECPQGGRRVCSIDKEIVKLTGVRNGPPPEREPADQPEVETEGIVGGPEPAFVEDPIVAAALEEPNPVPAPVKKKAPRKKKVAPVQASA